MSEALGGLNLTHEHAIAAIYKNKRQLVVAGELEHETIHEELVKLFKTYSRSVTNRYK